jgi:methionyl aminopeptidase
LGKLVSQVKPGVSTAALDELAEKEILKAGGRPSFKGYRIVGVSKGFNSAVCTSINEEVVHAPAHPSRTLKTGDIIGLDIGMEHPATGGYFTDMAVTVPVGAAAPGDLRLIKITRECLERGIAAAVPGARISDIGRAVQTHAEKNGFGVVRDLVGHGVGYAVHEDPRVPNYVDPAYPDVVLKGGMVLAIEPMITAGDSAVRTLSDEWTVVTADASHAAHWEVTIVVTKDGAEVLTPLPI